MAANDVDDNDNDVDVDDTENDSSNFDDDDELKLANNGFSFSQYFRLSPKIFTEKICQAN